MTRSKIWGMYFLPSSFEHGGSLYGPLTVRAEQRGLSFSDLLAEHAQQGLDRDG